MTYKLEFYSLALQEWKKLDFGIRQQFKKKLAERLENPKVESARLRGMSDCYKIKLRSSGYRLVYRVFDKQVVVLVVAIGKRDKSQVYKTASSRM